MRPFAAWIIGVLATLPAAAAEPITFVACAPGFPGSTEEAQPRMDAFAAAVARAVAGEPDVRAEYHETEDAGVARIGRPDAALALVPLPFFLKYETKLGLVARSQAVRQGSAASETWSLVAGKGRLSGPSALEGWELLSPAAYAPRFVRGTALGGWGKVPASTRLVAATAVLSGLRRAAAGEKVVLLLDGSHGAAVSTLPFASDLEVLARSEPLPVFVVAVVRGRLPEARARVILQALESLGRTPAGEAALSGLELDRFAPLDEAALRRAREAYLGAPDTP
jgi:hypothetical protein